MAIATLTLSGKQFVVLSQSEYRKLKEKAGAGGKKTPTRRPSKAGRVSAQDRGDVAESKRRLSDPKRIPAAEVFRRLGV